MEGAKSALGQSVFSRQDGQPKLAHSKTVYGDLRAAQEDGLYKNHYVYEHPVHYSDPPYSVIKPAYRPHVPIGMSNSLDMKH